MALGFDGEYYNVNANEMAAACAIACHADALVFLTDVPGVRARRSVLRWLCIDQIAEMAKAKWSPADLAQAQRLPRGSFERR